MTDVHTDARRGVKKWLRPKEVKAFHLILKFQEADDVAIWRETKAVFERLAACRALLKKHQWRKRGNGTLICICCGAVYLPDSDESNYIDESVPGRLPIIPLGKGKLCKPDCAIATALKGVGGE